MKLEQQAILITGGFNGIGRYLPQDLVTDVQEVIVSDRDLHGINDLREQVPGVTAYVCDLKKYQQVEDVVRMMSERDGKHVSVLINNAGLIHSELLVNLLSKSNKTNRMEAWDRIMMSILTASFMALHA